MTDESSGGPKWPPYFGRPKALRLQVVTEARAAEPDVECGGLRSGDSPEWDLLCGRCIGFIGEIDNVASARARIGHEQQLIIRCPRCGAPNEFPRHGVNL